MEPGQILGLLGPNGCGKTFFGIRAIAGLTAAPGIDNINWGTALAGLLG